MSEPDFKPGLEGVIAVETEIAEPDREGGSLRYRGVDIEELVGHYPFEKVWGLLVDGSFEPGMPHAERLELQDPSGSVMADLQAGLATLGAKWGLQQLVDMSPEQAREDLARLSAASLSLVAQAARGAEEPPVSEVAVYQGENAAAQFLIRWRGEANPRDVRAVDTYWVSAAEHGLNPSTFAARIAASTGADCAAVMSSAVGALSLGIPRPGARRVSVTADLYAAATGLIEPWRLRMCPGCRKTPQMMASSGLSASPGR